MNERNCCCGNCCYIPVPGPIGPIGPEGPQGIQGIEGPMGPQGIEGPMGPQGIEGPMGPQGIEGPMGPQGIQGPAGPVIAAGASITSHQAQTFVAPNYGMVTFDTVSAAHDFTVSEDQKELIVNTAGLYSIQYGMIMDADAAGWFSILFTPWGIDDGAKMPLARNVMVTGSIIRRLGAQTRVGIWIDSINNNDTITLPQTVKYCNAYLTIGRIGPYPS